MMNSYLKMFNDTCMVRGAVKNSDLFRPKGPYDKEIRFVIDYLFEGGDPCESLSLSLFRVYCPEANMDIRGAGIFASRLLSSIANDRDYYYLIEDIVRPEHKIHHEYLHKMIINSPDFNIMRDADGVLLPKLYFKSIKSKCSVHALLKNIVKHDDVEAFQYLSSLPYYGKLLDQDKLNVVYPDARIPLDSRVGKAVFGDSPKIDLAKAIEVLSRTSNKTPISAVIDHYTPEIGRKYGFAIMCRLFRDAKHATGPAVELLIKSLIRDGADVYCAYKMLKVDNAVRIDLKDRHKDPGAELSEMLNEPLGSVKKHHRALMEVILAHTDAGLVNKVVGHQGLKGMISPNTKDEPSNLSLF